MIFANDEKEKKTYILNAERGKNYYCPICNEKMVCKFGKIKSPHFAHPKHSTCTDAWHYDMSEWHEEWQSFFPKENQEVVFDNGKEKHRADIAIGNIIIEFQHSRIAPEEFLERNNFYHSINKKIIWVFDAENKISEAEFNSMHLEEGFLSSLNTNSEIFTEKSIRNSADLVFLCTYSDPDEEGDYSLYQTSWFWCANNLRRNKVIFGTDAYYNEKEFIDIITGKVKLESISDEGTIPYLWRKNSIKNEAIFEDEKGFRVKIVGDPTEMYEKYGRLYGHFSAPNKMHFNWQSKLVVGMKTWKLLSK